MALVGTALARGKAPDALGATDAPAAARWLRKAADAKCSQGYFGLGSAFANGWGMDTDVEAAEKWWRRAAEAGLVHAQYNLGALHYDQTEGLRDGRFALIDGKKYYNAPPKAMREAKKWLGKAAEGGHERAKLLFDRIQEHEKEAKEEQEKKKEATAKMEREKEREKAKEAQKEKKPKGDQPKQKEKQPKTAKKKKPATQGPGAVDPEDVAWKFPKL